MSPVPPSRHVPGPAVLGRGAVVLADQPSPSAWAGARRVTIDEAVLRQPGAAVAVLHHHWVRRVPVVVALDVANDALRAPAVIRGEPHTLRPDTSLDLERLHFLVWANTYDCRGGEPVWWHGVLAQRRGAGPSEAADARLPDGTEVWVDGGPRGPLPVASVHRESVALGRLTPGARTGPGDATADATTAVDHDTPDRDLAPDQRRAVHHGQGPARVIAPAGSGKTRVLTARLRHLLRDRRYEPDLVTAVAYNTRAATEMRERTADLGANIRTIHSLALWVCNLDQRRAVIDERQVRAILDDLVSVGRVPNQDPYQAYLEALAEVRLALRAPAEVEAGRDDVDGFAEVFADYREVLARRGLLDFDEQIYRAIEVLLTRPDLRQQVQRRCTHLLVDEFQDLTPAFLLLLRLAAGPSLQVFAVGDDDQTIYSYAGATPGFLIDFDRYFPGAAHYALEVNYRCPAPVVAAADTLLAHNARRVAKIIRAHTPTAPSPDGTGPTPAAATR